MNEWLPAIEAALEKYLAIPDVPYRSVAEAMAYSAKAGGKRLRPLLTLEFCRLSGGDPVKAIPFACAVEMIHTYSLIHDDLPCMDDDDYRRGRPSCHKQFGEATALLAGDALLTKAFGVLAEAELPGEIVAKAVRLLSEAAGPDGMVGGQVLDLQNENETPSAGVLELTYRLKTGALLRAACQLGVLAGGGTDRQLREAGNYAEKMGMAFQIVDDILDVTGDPSLLGKPVGSDEANGKTTFVSLRGLDGAKQLAARYSQEALEALDAFPGSGELAGFTARLLSREK